MMQKDQYLEAIYGGAPTCDAAKEFIDAIGQKFKESNKPEITSLLNSFLNTRYDIGVIRNYILKFV